MLLTDINELNKKDKLIVLVKDNITLKVINDKFLSISILIKKH